MFDLENYRKQDAIKGKSIWNSTEKLTYIAQQLWSLVPEKTKQRPSFDEFKIKENWSLIETFSKTWV